MTAKALKKKVKKTHSRLAAFFCKKKGPCALGARTHSERNLYGPPIKLYPKTFASDEGFCFIQL